MDENRYARQMLLPEIGEKGQSLLSHAKVLIVGVGGLGSPIALYLTAAGIGHLGLVDNDKVSVSNLQRQILYTETDINQPKVQCAKEHLQSINRETLIDTYNECLNSANAINIISQYDIVIDGCDNYATRYLINDTCIALRKTYIYGAVCGFEGQMAVFDFSKTNKPDYRTLYPNEAEMLQLKASKGIVGPTAGVAGSMMATEALKFICNFGSPLNGKMLCYNLLTNEQYTFEL